MRLYWRKMGATITYSIFGFNLNETPTVATYFTKQK
jgi:hypothetical protein